MTKRKYALVVGGGGGIGAACCQALSSGWFPLVADVDEAEAQKVAKDVGGRAIRLDVADAEGVETVAASLEAEIGAIDALVVAAAVIPPPQPFERVDLRKWDRVFDVNARGVFSVARSFGCRMAGAGRGSVVIISSMAGMVSIPHFAYGPSKAAITNLATSLAVQWGRRGVRVNTISPGPVRTPRIEESYTRGERNPDELSRQTALGRLIQPSEVAAAVKFLISDEASAITATNLVVDAGAISTLMWNLVGGVERFA